MLLLCSVQLSQEKIVNAGILQGARDRSIRSVSEPGYHTFFDNANFWILWIRQVTLLKNGL